MRLMLILMAALGLSACGSSDDGDPIDGVTPQEARALDNAAEMLDVGDNLAAPALVTNSGS